MLKLTFLQFRHSWKTWLGSLVMFTTAGFVLGFTLIGIGSTVYAGLDKGIYNPVLYFTIPVIFGLVTLILILGGITRLLINKFRDEYQLWSMLGANPFQLSVLISGQMGISAMLGGILGYVFAYPIVEFWYAWIRTTAGMREFPAVNMRIQLSSFLATVISLGIVVGLMGFIDARRIFHDMNVKQNLKRKNKFGLSLFNKIFCLIVLGSLIYLYSALLGNPQNLQKMFGSKFLVEAYQQSLILFLILLIIFINSSASILLPLIVRLLRLIFSNPLFKAFRTFETAYWSVLKKRDFLRSIVLPLFIFSLLCSFFTYLIFDLANVANKRHLSEIIESIVMFLGTPFLIILANTISLTIISSSERSASSNLLQTIGFSFGDLLREKSVEASLYGGTVFVLGTIGNILIFGPISRASMYTHACMYDTWLSVAIWPAITGIIVFIFVLVVDGIYISKINAMKSEQ